MERLAIVYEKLRKAIQDGDVKAVKRLIANAGIDSKTVVNFTAEENTLLFL